MRSLMQSCFQPEVSWSRSEERLQMQQDDVTFTRVKRTSHKLAIIEASFLLH
jgi:hypothetical protein